MRKLLIILLFICSIVSAQNFTTDTLRANYIKNYSGNGINIFGYSTNRDSNSILNINHNGLTYNADYSMRWVTSRYIPDIGYISNRYLSKSDTTQVISTNGEFLYNNLNKIYGATTLRYSTSNGYVAFGTITPTVKIHIDNGTSTASYMKFTAGTTTGTTINDGLDFGIRSTGTGLIRNFENRSIMVMVNGLNIMRFDSIGKAISYGGLSVGETNPVQKQGLQMKFLYGSTNYGGIITGGDAPMTLVTNLYLDSTDNRWEYIGTTKPASIQLTNGDILFNTGNNSGVANNLAFYPNRIRLYSTGTVRIGNPVTNYLQIDSVGNTLLVGAATSFEDLRTSATQLKSVGVANKPDFDVTNLTLDFPQNDTSEIVGYNFQIPHSWKQGSTIYPHVHIDQTANQAINFRIQYKWYNANATEPTAWSTLNMATQAYTWTTGTLHNMLTNSTGISGTGKTISSILKIKLYRTDNTYTGDVKVTEFDIHYEVDGFGSNSETTK